MTNHRKKKEKKFYALEFNHKDVNDDARPGQWSTSTTDANIETVTKMILNNRRITIREVVGDVGITCGSCQAIFMNFTGMKSVAAKIVLKLLNFKQKQRRMDIAQKMLTAFNDDPHNIETKAQLSQWKRPAQPRPKKAHQVRSNVKVSLTVFFDCNGLVHHEFLPQDRTVNKEYYLEVMRPL